MRITGIRVTNFERFRGDHEADLDAGVYAVIARSVDNPDRSNWLGKSSFLAAIRFVLFGSVRSDVLDGVISHGTGSVAVDLDLSDGSFITRSRDRGKSTQLRLESGQTKREYFQDEAQAEIVRLIGLRESEWLATVWCEQGAAARFVKSLPSERTRLINGWLALGPLEQAAEITRRRERSRSTELDRLVGELAVHDRILAEPPPDPAGLARLQSEIQSVSDRRVKWEREIRRVAEWHNAREIRAKWEADREALRAARRGLLDLPEPPDLAPLESCHTAAQAALSKAIEDASKARSLAAGDFDGLCPVTRSDCPVADTVRDRCKGDRVRVVRSDRAAGAARQAVETARQAVETARRAERDRDRAEREIARLAAAVQHEPADPGPRPAHPGECPSDSEFVAELSRLRSAIERYEQASQLRSEIEERAERIESLIRADREAAMLLGRGGAQRRIAERAVAVIEKDANRRLASVGIDLRVAIQWGREQQGLADVCDQCGAAFPKSARVRTCDHCGAKRNQKRDDSLYLDLSNRSGAAEDLAGVSIQLAAAAWLQGRRQANWGTVALDEPFGELDAENRRAFAQSVKALAADGFDQAFVVAHSADILDALPHRIVITGDHEWSSFRVEA